MNKQLEDYIGGAKGKLLLAKQEQVAEELARSEAQLDYELNLVKMACRHLPEVVHDYVRVWRSMDGYELDALVIDFGREDCAPIFMKVDEVVKDDKGDMVVHLERDPFRLGAWRLELVEDDDYYVAGLWPIYAGYECFDDALAAALEEGNNQERVQAMAVARNRAKNEPVHEKLLQCPLTVMVEDEQGYCVRSACAWWVKDGCAVAMLARGLR